MEMICKFLVSATVIIQLLSLKMKKCTIITFTKLPDLLIDKPRWRSTLDIQSEGLFPG